MMNQVLNSLISGGLGALLASVAVALINAFSKKGESRASAADLVTQAAGGLIDRLEKTNARLDKENKDLRKAFIKLTDVLDEIIEESDIGPNAKRRLHDANNAAKTAI
jgi:hypothetical protein